jgi:hypothetical protein
MATALFTLTSLLLYSVLHNLPKINTIFNDSKQPAIFTEMYATKSVQGEIQCKHEQIYLLMDAESKLPKYCNFIIFRRWTKSKWTI